MVQNELFTKSRLDRLFEEYDKEHPHVFRLFKTFALSLKKRGLKHYGAKAIMERIRWQVAFETGNDGFKINNNFTSRYARKLEREMPEFKGFFRKRVLK